MSSQKLLSFCEFLLQPQKNRSRWFWSSFLCVLVVWALCTETGWVQSLFLPPPSMIGETFWSLISEAQYNNLTLQQHWGVSLYTIGLSFLIALLIGIPTGVALATIPPIQYTLDTWIEWCRPIPPLAYLNIIVLLFGFGFFSKVVVLVFAMVMPIILTTRTSLRNLPKEALYSSLTFGIKRWQVVWYLLLPTAFPGIITGLRIAMGIGWSTLVAAEMITPEFGLGAVILNAANFVQIDTIYIGMLAIAVSAWCIDKSLRWILNTIQPYTH